MAIEDEWDRDPEAMDLEDLLFVTFDTQELTSAKILEVVKREGFDAQIRSNSSPSDKPDAREPRP